MLKFFAGDMRICTDVNSLSLWAGRSGDLGNLAPLDVPQECLCNTKQSFPEIPNPSYFYLFSQDVNFLPVCCQIHTERPKQNRRDFSIYLQFNQSDDKQPANIWAGWDETSSLAVQSFCFHINGHATGSSFDLQLHNLNPQRLGGLIKTTDNKNAILHTASQPASWFEHS